MKYKVNVQTDPPIIHLQDLDEIASFDGYPAPGGGYSWFPDDVEEGSGPEPDEKADDFYADWRDPGCGGEQRR